FVGSTVLAVYDKAVEYIAGGSNVADIKEFFWKWKRAHHPMTESSLDRSFGNQSKPNEAGMETLGVFGSEIAVPAEGRNGQAFISGVGSTRGMKAGMAGMGGMGGGMAMMARAPAAPTGRAITKS